MRRWWQEGERKTFFPIPFLPPSLFPPFFASAAPGWEAEERKMAKFYFRSSLSSMFPLWGARRRRRSPSDTVAPRIFGAFEVMGVRTYGCTLPSGVQLGTGGGSNCLHFWRFHCTRFTGGHCRGSNERIKKRGRGKVGSIQRELWSSPRLSIVSCTA